MAQKPNKLPPQNIEAEQSLLGGLLIDKDAVVKIAEILKPEHFYKEQHAKIYEAIINLFEKREPIDQVTVTTQLRQNGNLDLAGGPAYLATVVNTVPTSAHIEHYAHIVKEHSIRRNMISQATRLVETAYDEGTPVHELLEEGEQSIFSLSQDNVKRDFVPLKDLLVAAFDQLDELQKNSGKMRGVPSGFRDLDNKTAGFQNSNLVIIAARPGVGKCLAFNSQIINPDTGEVLTIEEYYRSNLTPILTLDENLKIKKSAISHFVDDGFKDVYQVKTSTGREIEVTASHPFLTIEGWKKMSQLNVGECIATPRSIPVFGSGELEDFKVKAIAYYLSDGGLTSSSPRFTNVNPDIVADFTESVLSFENIKVTEYDSGGQRASSYEVTKSKRDDADIIKKDFSLQLKELIKGKQITQYFLASQLGASTASVSLWVNGKTIPDESYLSSLSLYFGKDRNYFLPDNFLGFKAKSSVKFYLEELGLSGKNAFQKRVPKIIFTLKKRK